MLISVNRYVFVAIVFVATAVWDLLLRVLVNSSKSLGYPIFPIMQPYFSQVGVFQAMLYAGIVGAVAKLTVLLLAEVTRDRYGLYPSLSWSFLSWIAVVSALVGIAMRVAFSGLPYLSTWKPVRALQNTYYQQHWLRTFALDGLSGVLVAAPVLSVFRPDEGPKHRK
jgi:hypothetical protein